VHLGARSLQECSVCFDSAQVKLDERKSNGAGLAQENVFGSAQLPKLPWLVKGTTTAEKCSYRKVCNKYDLTAAQYF
jgi:hypothetical protein